MNDCPISENEARQNVPIGSYCYDTVHVEGRDLKELEEALEREFPGDFGAQFVSFLQQTKPVWCPYWHTTEHGTVRCNYLGIEAVRISSEEYWNLAVRHFGSEEAVNAACEGFLLGDAVKVCGLNNR